MSKSSLAAINTHTEKDVLKLNYSIFLLVTKQRPSLKFCTNLERDRAFGFSDYVAAPSA